MFKIYGIKNCSTMKKAFEALQSQALSYEFHDYKKQGIDKQTIQNWLKQVDQAVLLNKKGTTWRKLPEETQQFALQNQENLIQTMIEHPSLIKRPVLESERGILVGYDAESYQSLTAN